MIGRTLGHFRVIEKLGEGGMGDVYLAEDTKLARKVALKVLPEEMASETRLARFEREARAVAALNHPNIVHVYSVEQVDGVHFITMELVRGKTLTELLPKHGFPLSKFFDIAAPLADAVAAAHEEGITHRDLKPDNVMLGDDGRVKVLDFGLAKAVGGFVAGDSELPTQTRTKEGAIVGTVQYMSPEQAAGKAVDPRSDIFSMGILFYEMLTGRRPFEEGTPAEVLSAILKETPRPIEGVPRELAKLVSRCLAKEPRRRVQTALDVSNALEELKADWSSGELREAAPASRPPASRVWIPVSVGVALLVGALIFFTRAPRQAVVRLTNPTQITRGAEVEDAPAVSPDGQMVAYVDSTINTPGRDIWIARLGGGQPVNRTAGLPGGKSPPSWSPDGSEIAFTWERENGAYLYTMPVLAGAPRRVATDVTFLDSPQWSRDGGRLAYLVAEESGAIEIRSLRTGDVKRLPLPPPTYRVGDLAWSPDGRFFAYDVGGQVMQVTRLLLLRVADGEVIPVTDGRGHDYGPSWSPDGRTLYYVSNRSGSRDLWQQRIADDGTPQGEPQPVTTGVGMRKASISPDGTKVAYSKGGPVANVWRVPILTDRPATWADAEQITHGESFIEFLDLSPDGKRVAISSDHAGNPDIWVLPASGGEMQPLTTDPTPDWAPRWSPDGQQIAFYSYRSGNRDIWVMPADGGAPLQLTTGATGDWMPAWSPDGREIAFGSDRGGGGIWVVSSKGGEPRHVATPGQAPVWSPDVPPAWSPDGRWLFVGGGWLVPASGGEAEPMVRGMTSDEGGRWSKEGTEIYFARKDGNGANFWALSVADRKERQLTALEGRKGRLPGYAPATDGRYLYFAWWEELGDIWVMDVVTGKP